MMKCEHKKTSITEPHLAGARECDDCGARKFMGSGPWHKRVWRFKFQSPFRFFQTWKEIK